MCVFVFLNSAKTNVNGTKTNENASKVNVNEAKVNAEASKTNANGAKVNAEASKTNTNEAKTNADGANILAFITTVQKIVAFVVVFWVAVI